MVEKYLGDKGLLSDLHCQNAVRLSGAVCFGGCTSLFDASEFSVIQFLLWFVLIKEISVIRNSLYDGVYSVWVAACSFFLLCILLLSSFILTALFDVLAR